MPREIIKKYSNNELTIVWKPAQCSHSGVCVKTLPKVYDPKATPWLTIDKATTEELKEQVTKCPSGALSYYMNEDKDNGMKSEALETKVEIIENGPLLVYGTLNVTYTNGKTESKEKATAFCRCGQSNNKPYCDGNHTKVDFRG